MSATFFQSELTNLIQESKKKHPELKAAAEKSLADLKAIRVSSETQLAGDLVRNPFFCDAFILGCILGCRSHSPKLVSSGVVGLQRLVATRSLPGERLRDVVEALHGLSGASLEIQIKILQTLPSLSQNYPSELRGDVLFTCLDICGALQGGKSAIVASTAAATFQQLVTSVLERIDDKASSAEIIGEIEIRGVSIQLTQNSKDGLDIFADICSLSDGTDGVHLKHSHSSPLFILDLIGTVLTTNEDVFEAHVELLELCRAKLLPSLLRRLSTKQPFGVAIRSLNLLLVVIKQASSIFPEECGTALGLLLHIAETEVSQVWKRVACLEVLSKIIADFPLIFRIFRHFDMEETRQSIVGRLLGLLAKLAAEKPAVIGLGQQSTIPARENAQDSSLQSQASLEAAGVEGMIASTVTAESNVVGISTSRSLPKARCLDLMDKSDSPILPETYLYALVLESLISISDALAKFVMPIATSRSIKRAADTSTRSQDAGRKSMETPKENQRRPRSAGRSSRPGHEESIQTAVAFVKSCWPPLLATCATFLNAALDADFYHHLIRGVQRFAQVSGILELTTPRDAFLTTLAKSTIPIPTGSDPRRENPRQNTMEDPTSPKVASAANIGKGVPSDIQLTSRNLLCLRALLNLGIALGPSLGREAWLILLETCQESEHLISQSRSLHQETAEESRSDPSVNMATEVVAVQNASRKMFASSINYNSEVFRGLVTALLSLSSPTDTGSGGNELTPITPARSRRAGRMHQSTRSTSGAFSRTTVDDKELLFVLTKTSEISRANLPRLAKEGAEDSGWLLISNSLLHTIKSDDASSEMRIRAAMLLNSIAIGTMQLVAREDESRLRSFQERVVSTLQNQIDGLYQSGPSQADKRHADLVIHERAIESLISMVEEQGEYFQMSWEPVLQLGDTTFDRPTEDTLRVRSPKLLATCFRLVQLVHSDFMQVLPLKRLLQLLDLLVLFGRQQEDLNLSLTSITALGRVAAFSAPSDLSSLCRVDESFTGRSLEEQVEKGEHAEAAIWFLVPIRLVALAVDGRLEVRRSAMKTLFSELSSEIIHDLSTHGWEACFTLIIFPIFKFHVSRLRDHEDPTSYSDWIVSAEMLITTTFWTMQKCLSVLAKLENASSIWDQLLSLLEELLGTPALELSIATFAVISFDDSEESNQWHSLDNIDDRFLQLWFRRHPADTLRSGGDVVGSLGQDRVQEAFALHAKAWDAFFMRVAKGDSRWGTPELMSALEKTITWCVHPRYSSDVKKMASEQERVVEILEHLLNTVAAREKGYHSLLCDFTLMALRSEEELIQRFNIPAEAWKSSLQASQRLTWVAFSNRSMLLLQASVLRVSEASADYIHIVERALEALSTMIQAKYTPNAHRGDPSLWAQATQSALCILDAVPSQPTGGRKKDQQLIWRDLSAPLIGIASGVLGAGGLASMTPPLTLEQLESDEAQDITAFNRLMQVLLPALDHNTDHHRAFAHLVYDASLIADPQFGDKGPPPTGSVSLSSLSTIRRGTIKTITYRPRSRIAYLALDTLFQLSAAPTHQPAPEKTALARSILPFLLQRISHTFRSFIADQPLRSPLPFPSRLRFEMLHILRASLDLYSDDDAFAGLGGDAMLAKLGRDGKRHLRLLFQLVLRVQKTMREVPRGGWSWVTDGEGVEMDALVGKWLDECGSLWALGDGE